MEVSLCLSSATLCFLWKIQNLSSCFMTNMTDFFFLHCTILTAQAKLNSLEREQCSLWYMLLFTLYSLLKLIFFTGVHIHIPQHLEITKWNTFSVYFGWIYQRRHSVSVTWQNSINNPWEGKLASRKENDIVISFTYCRLPVINRNFQLSFQDLNFLKSKSLKKKQPFFFPQKGIDLY